MSWIKTPDFFIFKSDCGRFRIHGTRNRPPSVPRWSLIDYEAEGYDRKWPLITTHPTLEDAQFWAEWRLQND